MDVGPHVCHATEKIAEFELKINEKDIVISELRAEVDFRVTCRSGQTEADE
ncbi:hypothetical protein HYC85_003881 [Camellia sinensis]|uniref:Uncharacterized protein n=1 Tax=Camellia sinensis TaxID=4442 RepID=A0A7J7HX16_CAMSI|nr:hypothetical protein HYC85_003881 [Camellia sinensis]